MTCTKYQKKLKNRKKDLFRKNKLGAIEFMKYGMTFPLIIDESDINDWKRIFQLIDRIRHLSVGGNSVEDIYKERER